MLQLKGSNFGRDCGLKTGRWTSWCCQSMSPSLLGRFSVIYSNHVHCVTGEATGTCVPFLLVGFLVPVLEPVFESDVVGVMVGLSVGSSDPESTWMSPFPVGPFGPFFGQIW
jgi:hypothetical protein